MNTDTAPGTFTIFCKAAKIIWNCRPLWPLGVIAAAGTAGMYVGINVTNQQAEESTAAMTLATVAILIVIFSSVRFFSLGAATIFVHNEEKSAPSLFASIKISARLLPSLLLMWASLCISGLLLFVVFLFPGTVILNGGDQILATTLLFGGLLILFPIIFLLALIGRFGEFYILLSRLSVKSSLDAAYALFRKNIGSSILFAASIVFVEATLYVLFTFLIFASVNFLAPPPTSPLPLYVLYFLIAAFLDLFHQISWLLFFKKIATVDEEESPIAQEAMQGAQVTILQQEQDRNLNNLLGS